MKQLSFYFLFAILFGLTSCSKLFLWSFGINDVEELTTQKIEAYANKLGIPQKYSFMLDTNFKEEIKRIVSKTTYKNHIQPLKVLYFSSEGRQIAKFINCNCGGFPNLTWNVEHNLDSYPPTTQTPIDTIVTWQFQKKYLIPISSSANLDTTTNTDIVCVFWNRFMFRQSKRLIEEIRRNTALSKNNKAVIYYINNDNFMYQL